MGVIQSRARYYSQKELLDNLQTFRQKKFPLDVMVQDWMYWGKYGWNAMRFDEKGLSRSGGDVKTVHEQHAHAMISVWSRIAGRYRDWQGVPGEDFYVPWQPTG